MEEAIRAAKDIESPHDLKMWQKDYDDALHMCKGKVYARRGDELRRAAQASRDFDKVKRRLDRVAVRMRKIVAEPRRFKREREAIVYTRQKRKEEAKHTCYGCWTTFFDPAVLITHLSREPASHVQKHVDHIAKL
jgi:hypothetical protein